ncbi:MULTISPECIES: sensor domain-containing diguanylate cyclase [Gammaproteobacteria]|uniref:GGDEF domain-containing protein n=1 Tax=Gammaproteobacteria TaxID=1236 RepID=UPI000DCF82BC|nr:MULTISPECIES: sensor domain-containing diguanylate cyclase [Gammaproteobacteria]RTE86725.1 sensor domain-containing diguanylate cyclase [Aliidiomarina sp. B3213]TCZ90721.1 sensor domain-containing diguanylate cyclase [Lysobacter sp. N42]
MEKMLKELAIAVSDSEDLESFVRPLLKMMEAITGLESTYMTRVNNHESIQNVIYAEHKKKPFVTEGLQVPWNDTLCKRALDDQIFYTDRVSEIWADSGAAREIGIETYISQPINLSDGTFYGTLCGASADRVKVNQESRKILNLFAELIAHQIERERMLKRLQSENITYKHFALTDQLTGIPNRRASIIELSRAMNQVKRSGSTLLVAYIDLDGFKKINDNFGHDAGDRFLIEIAKVLIQNLRDSDFVGRLGGDEFLAFGIKGQEPNLVSKETLKSRVEQFTQGLFDLGDYELSYEGASVGVVSYEGDDITVDRLLNQADSAMYLAKQKRKAKY